MNKKFKIGDKVRTVAGASKYDTVLLTEGDVLEVVLGPWENGAYTSKRGSGVPTYGLKVISLASEDARQLLKSDRLSGVFEKASKFFGFPQTVETVVGEDKLEVYNG